MSELVVAAFAAETGTHVVDEPRQARFAAFRRRFDRGAYAASLAARGLRFLARSAPGFPPLLRAIHDPPVGLFLRGRVEPGLLSRPAVAIVGARACSPYGSQVARMLGRELARRIGERGLVVSEYAPGVEPAPWRFPARNRIIAGLCAATVVVEAREASGALITADLALEEGREVFACPGEITSALSAGSNALLRLGATPLTAARDVLESFGIEETAAHPIELSAPAQAVLQRLRDAAASADELARATELDAAELAVALSELELAGLAVQADGVYRAVSQ